MMSEQSDQISGDKSLKERVAEAVDTIRPFLQNDGGDIELIDVQENGVVQVQLQGACSGCPCAAVTLKQGVERTLKEKVPEVTEVISV